MPSKSEDEIALTTQCCDCGINRYFTKYEVARNRHEKPRCRVCAIKHYHANKPKKSQEHKKQIRKQYYENNKEKLDSRSNEWREQKRLQYIAEFGSKCVSCGESDPIVLDFDHINDDGAQHRRETKKSNVVYIFAKKGVNLSQFQLLCKNCNWRKEYHRRKNAKYIKKTA